MVWYENNYRRNLMDMHIDDWNEEFLSKLNCEEYVEALKDAGVQTAMVKAMPHTGLKYYPSKIGRMHRGLKNKDFVGEMVERCHAAGIKVELYFSQVFDNWAYNNHPDWRCITANGLTFKEWRGEGFFRNGRYGIVCPNNEDYRNYVKENVQEICQKYKFEGMFLDMTFWPDVCFCPSCRKKYFEQTGRELPRTVDFHNKEFLEYINIRDGWMADFARFTTKAIKEINPEITVEHQFSMISCSWIHACSESIMEAVDYAGGDYYGGYLQQSFINKYYKSVSPNLPFTYHTSRCDPELCMHTTTKTREQLLLHVITALIHNGAFLLVDAINPDGSIVPEVYHNLMKSIYSETSQYEPYISGKLKHNAAIWYASHAKYDPTEAPVDMTQKNFCPDYFTQAPIGVVSILRENNIPFDVIGSKNITAENADVLILPNIAHIREDEMDAIEAYVKKGGNLLVSGPIGNKRLAEMFGVEQLGYTKHEFTYMSPTAAGAALFEGFDQLTPLTIPRKQMQIGINDEDDVEVLATVTLPYTEPDTTQFAAIHSNPPGIYTDQPAVIRRQIGTSTLIWTSAPIEMSQPYMSRNVFRNLLQSLMRQPVFRSNAPKFVEVLNWTKEDKEYLAVLNEQEESPIAPMVDIYVEVPGENKKAVLLSDKSSLRTENVDGYTRIYLPKLDVYQMIEVISE